MLEACEQLLGERQEMAGERSAATREAGVGDAQSIGSLLPQVLARYLPAAEVTSDASFRERIGDFLGERVGGLVALR
jgi:hypothetical protein